LSSPHARNAGSPRQQVHSVSATSAGFPSSSPTPRRWISGSTNGSCQVTFKSRVLDGGLDAAVAWAGTRDERLDVQLLWPEPLLAVTPAGRTEATVPARKLRVLVDADLTSWQAWNDFATEFAADTGARLVHIDDGGIAGTAFHHHALRLNGPVLMSPKRYFDRLPRAYARFRSSSRTPSGAGRS
jgi:hypothetical protein